MTTFVDLIGFTITSNITITKNNNTYYIPAESHLMLIKVYDNKGYIDCEKSKGYFIDGTKKSNVAEEWLYKNTNEMIAAIPIKYIRRYYLTT
jgi:hypothetical protein